MYIYAERERERERERGKEGAGKQRDDKCSQRFRCADLTYYNTKYILI